MDGGRSLTEVLSEMWRKKQMPKSSYLTEAVYSCLRMTACIPFKYSKLELLRNTYVHATCYSSSPTPSYDACHAPTVRELIFRLIRYTLKQQKIYDSDTWAIWKEKGLWGDFWKCAHLYTKSYLVFLVKNACWIDIVYCIIWSLTSPRIEKFRHTKYSYGSTI